MALTAVTPKSSPDLHLPVCAYKVVGLHDVFTAPCKERIGLSWFTGEELRFREVQV